MEIERSDTRYPRQEHIPGSSCPWCGCAILDIRRMRRTWSVLCQCCGARGPVADSAKEAQAAWDRRMRE